MTLFGRQGVASGVRFELRVPPAALAAPTRVTVTETSFAMPDDLGLDDSPLYRIEPLDLQLAVPAHVQVPYSNGDGSLFFDQRLALFWSDTSTEELVRVPGGYVNAGFMQANIDRFRLGGRRLRAGGRVAALRVSGVM
ncbi:MAG: hypothetical protein JNK82_13170 [Myxococcaceae bacterium]|nr:hypothetical protein [Myxococcaceae bacterium]